MLTIQKFNMVQDKVHFVESLVIIKDDQWLIQDFVQRVLGR